MLNCIFCGRACIRRVPTVYSCGRLEPTRLVGVRNGVGMVVSIRLSDPEYCYINSFVPTRGIPLSLQKRTKVQIWDHVDRRQDHVDHVDRTGLTTGADSHRQKCCCGCPVLVAHGFGQHDSWRCLPTQACGMCRFTSACLCSLKLQCIVGLIYFTVTVYRSTLVSLQMKPKSHGQHIIRVRWIEFYNKHEAFFKELFYCRL